MRSALAFAILLSSCDLWAAACCGGNNLFPSLISGDERAQVSATTTYANTVGDASVAGVAVPRSSEDFETRSVLRLDTAFLLSDRWQVGASLPLIRRYRGRNGSQADALGLGDVSASVAFEILPQWTYSAWRPKGLVFAGVTAPTGRPPNESVSLYQIDALGRGYWTLNVGALLQKTSGDWDLLWMGEAHQSFARTVSTEVGDFHLLPTPGGSFSLGAGHSWGDLRIGAMLAAVFEGPVRTQGLVNEVGADQLSFPLTIQASYLFAPGWSVGAFYADNSLFGARNVALSRSVSVLLQTRWDR